MAQGNWQQAGTGSGSGSGGGGGGGDDVTDWGGFVDGKPSTVTINGVTQTIGRDGSGNIISYTIDLAGAADIVTTLSYDNGYSEASGNILRGGAIAMTAAQAAALKADILDSLGAAANGFKVRVTDLFFTTTTAAATAIYHDGVLEWQNHRFRPVSGCAFDVWHNATHVANSGESAALATIVLPRFLNKRGAIWRQKATIDCAGGASSTLALAMKVNGNTRATATSGSGASPSCIGELDINCLSDAAQFLAASALAFTGGTGATSAALSQLTIDSATTDITLAVHGTAAITDGARSITQRLTRVEFLA